MDLIMNDLSTPSNYVDREFPGPEEEYHSLIASSCTMYIGNLSFYTTEEQIYELFSKAGRVKRVIMGLDRIKRTPCGFCFVEYFQQSSARRAKLYLDGLCLDNRALKVDWDAGFRDGRQLGRGKSGGQIRDELREDNDPDRGGWGQAAQKRIDTDESDDEDEFGRVKRRRNGKFESEK